MLLSAAAVEAFGAATAKFYSIKGLLAHVPGGSGDGGDGVAADVLADLEARTGLPASAVAETLAAVATAVNGEPDAFGKRTFPAAASYGSAAIGSRGLWVAAVTPALHYSMGGLTFSASAEVLAAASRKPIRRLYAAGEVTGGLFGGNRLGGCSLLDCAVFGRIAGARAAAAAATATTVPTVGAAAAGAPAAPALSPGTLVPLRLSARRFLTANGASSGRSPSAMMALRFDLPSPLQATGAAVGQYVAAAVPLPDGTTTKRYYSPVSRPTDEGVLELLIKSPPPPAAGGGGGGGGVHVGSASAALGALRPGDEVAFDGPHGGLPFPLDGPGHLAVVVGGTGVSVGVQLVRHALYTAQTRLDAAADGGPLSGGGGGTCAAAVTLGLTLVWAVATPEQLVYQVRMEAQSATDAGRAVPLRLVFVVEAGGEAMVSDAPAPAAAAAAAAVAAGNGTSTAVRLGATPAGTPVYAGRVDAALLAAELPAVAATGGNDAYAVLCGPPPMCKGVRAAVEGMGYRHENVYSWV